MPMRENFTDDDVPSRRDDPARPHFYRPPGDDDDDDEDDDSYDIINNNVPRPFLTIESCGPVDEETIIDTRYYSRDSPQFTIAAPHHQTPNHSVYAIITIARAIERQMTKSNKTHKPYFATSFYGGKNIKHGNCLFRNISKDIIVIRHQQITLLVFDSKTMPYFRKESTPIILYDGGWALKISYAAAAAAAANNNYRHLVAEFAATQLSRTIEILVVRSVRSNIPVAYAAVNRVTVTGGGGNSEPVLRVCVHGTRRRNRNRRACAQGRYRTSLRVPRRMRGYCYGPFFLSPKYSD
ncbi:hypothetical protein QTP88_016073 [Uroleucon formosanum]